MTALTKKTAVDEDISYKLDEIADLLRELIAK